MTPRVHGTRFRCVAPNSETNETGEMLEDLLFWLLVLPGLLLGAYAQWRIKANVAKYSQVSTKDGITGAEVARRLLDSRGLQDVKIEATPGMLTDHYDPRTKILGDVKPGRPSGSAQSGGRPFFDLQARFNRLDASK